MKALLLFPLFLFSIMNAMAQNLVPNPSFEQYINCPDNGEEMYDCADWWSAGLANTTPDYFNECSSNPSISPPDVDYGYQVPFSGAAYAFVVTYVTVLNNYREYIQAALINPLIIGNEYYISFYASTPGGGDLSFASDKLGALLTTYQFQEPSYAIPLNFAHVYTDSLLTDSVNWCHVKGTIIADSAYKYITIGNFFDDTHTDFANLGENTDHAAGYFIDEVCVSSDSTHCFITEGISASSLGVVSIYPVPVDKYLVIQQSGMPVQGTITDNLGREIIQVGKEQKSKEVIDCSKWLNGVYYLRANGIQRKVIIQHN